MAKPAVQARAPWPPPGVNDLVRVTVGGDPGDEWWDGFAGSGRRRPGAWVLACEVPSRVEDAVVDRRTGTALEYVIAAPRFPGDVERLPVGTGCALQWVTARGLCHLLVELLAEEVSPAGLRTWRLTVTGPVVRHERRRFVRVPWQLPAGLVVRHDLEALPADRRAELQRADVLARLADLPAGYQATVLNVSEGGLLCMSPGPVMPGGLPLIASFTIEDTAFETPAQVIWSIPRPGVGRRRGTPPLVESAIAFDEPERYGEILRPLVFRAQLRARRLEVR